MVQVVQVMPTCGWRVFFGTVCVLKRRELVFSENLPYSEVAEIDFIQQTDQNTPGFGELNLSNVDSRNVFIT